MSALFASVIIPALNCAHEVDGCIAALREQDYPAERFEIIVVDNGSTDDTVARLQALRVTTVTRRERGRSRALNAGLAMASGDVILTTDMSCRPHRSWIRKVVECFADPTVGCVAGEIRLLHTDRSNLALRFQERTNYMSAMRALSRRQLPHLPFADGANASFRRRVFEEIGGFEESFFKGADVEICYRLLVLTDYKIVFCPDCLVEETGEPDLKALLRQRFRMGMGANLMQARFPAFYTQRQPMTLKHLYWRLRSSLRGLMGFTTALVQRDWVAVEDEWVRCLMGIAQTLGKHYGAWYLRHHGIRPTPMTMESMAAFINRIDTLDKRIVLVT